jgi:hypothetical protein
MTGGMVQERKRRSKRENERKQRKEEVGQEEGRKGLEVDHERKREKMR